MLKKGRAKLSRRAVQVKLKWWLLYRRKKKKKKRRRIERRRFILLRRFSPSFLRPYSLRDEEDDVDGDNNETASLPFPSLSFPSLPISSSSTSQHSQRLSSSGFFVLFFSSSRVKVSRISRRIVPRNGDASDAGNKA